jgi:hypothetical protein
MDALLKTNIKEYLIDHMISLGYQISENKVIAGKKFNTKTINKDMIKECIVSLLNLNNETLTDFERKLVSNDKELEKHFNLRIFIKKNFEYKITESISKNLFTETIKNKITKIKICYELMKVLEITSLDKLNKDLTNKFNDTINSFWLNENLETIKKLFDIRTNKYNEMIYYNTYILFITVLKHLFDTQLVESKRIKINYYCYSYNHLIMEQHMKIMELIPYDFID